MAFADAVEPRECISRSRGVLMEMHGVATKLLLMASWPSLMIVSVYVTF